MRQNFPDQGRLLSAGESGWAVCPQGKKRNHEAVARAGDDPQLAHAIRTGLDIDGEYPLIGAAVVVVALLIPRAARLLRGLLTSSKGTIAFDLVTDFVHSGERLHGKLRLNVSNPVRGVLKVSLLGKENSNRGGGSGRRRLVEMYRVDQVLEADREFPEHFMKDYSFELKAPSADESRPSEAALSELRKAADSKDNPILNFAIDLIKRSRRKIYWYIEARLEVDGFDVVEKKRIQVALRN